MSDLRWDDCPEEVFRARGVFVRRSPGEIELKANEKRAAREGSRGAYWL